eukprot:TRINITY_DN80240_c0_g1_i1.p1 TRINITY_DN80240_c0_g1~~TRINITY_DN80240_c0_g1_i1.p1  ORF type:complete len:211 (+),score=33.67 TRINITY_DN80240_c0_g1_i1:71-703(+)
MQSMTTLATFAGNAFQRVPARDVLLLLAGSVGTWVYAILRGHVRPWFGAEKKRWSRQGWNEEEQAILERWKKQGAEIVSPQPSSRNWVGEDHPRRVTRIYAWFPAEQRGRALVRYGADTEGPPQSVHGGCTATVVDAFMGFVAYRATQQWIVTANLHVNYRSKVPSGSTVIAEAWISKQDGRKTFLDFTVKSLEEVLHNDGNSLFISVKK